MEVKDMDEYTLVFRKNKFVGLYNMTERNQEFNTTIDLLPLCLKEKLGEGQHNINIIIEGNERVNPLNLPTLEEYLNK
jgi:hypothetical protein